MASEEFGGGESDALAALIAVFCERSGDPRVDAQILWPRGVPKPWDEDEEIVLAAVPRH